MEIFSNTNPTEGFSDEKKTLIQNSLADWAAASGIVFTEVDDSVESYGDLRFINELPTRESVIGERSGGWGEEG